MRLRREEWRRALCDHVPLYPCMQVLRKKKHYELSSKQPVGIALGIECFPRYIAGLDFEWPT